MRIKPQHFHLVVAAMAGAGAIASAAYSNWLLAVFLLAGGVVALIQWKAVKSGYADS